MAIQNVKAVVLIGDPKQLPPTVISEHEKNEGADHLAWSLTNGETPPQGLQVDPPPR